MEVLLTSRESFFCENGLDNMSFDIWSMDIWVGLISLISFCFYLFIKCNNKYNQSLNKVCIRDDLKHLNKS